MTLRIWRLALTRYALPFNLRSDAVWITLRKRSRRRRYGNDPVVYKRRKKHPKNRNVYKIVNIIIHNNNNNDRATWTKNRSFVSLAFRRRIPFHPPPPPRSPHLTIINKNPKTCVCVCEKKIPSPTNFERASSNFNFRISQSIHYNLLPSFQNLHTFRLQGKSHIVPSPCPADFKLATSDFNRIRFRRIRCNLLSSFQNSHT